jgi:hypothetical protein
MYLTNLIAKSQRILNNSKINKLYHIMNNMKYSKYIRDLETNLYANIINAKKIDRIYAEGAVAFEKDGKIVAVYDYVNQTLYTNKKELLEVI